MDSGKLLLKSNVSSSCRVNGDLLINLHCFLRRDRCADVNAQLSQMEKLAWKRMMMTFRDLRSQRMQVLSQSVPVVDLTSTADTSASMRRNYPSSTTSYTPVTYTEEKLVLQLYEGLQVTTNASIANVNQPSSLLIPLRQHQKQALAWMIDREKDTSGDTSSEEALPEQTKKGCSVKLPSGWEERRTEGGIVYYFNKLTKATTWEHPSKVRRLVVHGSDSVKTFVRGGILADEMGMGKLVDHLLHSLIMVR